MTRPRRNAHRQRRRSSAQTSPRRSWLIAAAIVGGPLIIIIAGAIWLKWSAFQYEYGVDLCLKNQPLSGHTILVIDATDALDATKSSYLKTLLKKTKQNLKPFSKFSIFSIDRVHGGFPRQVFSLCNPGTADTTNIFAQAPAHVQRKFDEEFARPLDKVTADLKSVENSDNSPL